ncbi:MAG: Nif3-like dinuclear metal center hexameric protein, partial [Planctomycetaceae bacterium]
MLRLLEITTFLREIAPLELAEEWDNVGLLIGDEQQQVKHVLTCLTLSPDVAAEAVSRQVDLVVAHHPILFRPVQRLTSDMPEGTMLLSLIAAGVAVYSPHTAFDSAADGRSEE